MSQEHYTYTELGLMLSTFMVGAGLLQVPAGVFSARKGPNRAVVLGLAILAAASLVSAASPNVFFQAATRFVTGVGAAFYFAPAMVVVSGLYRGRSGLLIGIYNAAFNLGGGITLFALTPAAALWGWRAPYIVTGLATLVALAQHLAVFRGATEDPVAEKTGGLAALRSRSLWGVAVGILGLSVAYYVASQFVVDYATDSLHLGASDAGLVSSLILFGGLLGGPIVGSLSDRAADRRIYVAASSIAAAICIALFYYPSRLMLGAAAFALGFFDSAAYTIAYAIPTDQLGRRDAPLAIGLINSLSIMVGAAAVALFGHSIPLLGYRTSWLVVAAVAALTLPALRLVGAGNQKETHKNFIT